MDDFYEILARYGLCGEYKIDLQLDLFGPNVAIDIWRGSYHFRRFVPWCQIYNLRPDGRRALVEHIVNEAYTAIRMMEDANGDC